MVTTKVVSKMFAVSGEVSIQAKFNEESPDKCRELIIYNDGQTLFIPLPLKGTVLKPIEGGKDDS